MMKFQIGTLLVAALAITSVSSLVASSRSVAGGISDNLKKPLENTLARALSEQVVLRLEKHFRDEADRESRATLIPPADDPACVEPVGGEITIPIGDSISIGLYGNLTAPLVVTGLSKIVDELTVNLVALQIGWDFSVPAIDVKGEYDARLDVSAGGMASSIYGFGNLLASVKNVFFNFLAKGGVVAGKIQLTDLDVDLGFSDFAVDGGNASADGGATQVNWEEISTGVNDAFTQVWGNETTKAQILELIQCSLNYVVGGCGIGDISNITGCLRFNLTELAGECLIAGDEGPVETSLLSFARRISVPWANTCQDVLPTVATTEGVTGSTQPGGTGSTGPGGSTGASTPEDDGTGASNWSAPISNFLLLLTVFTSVYRY